MTSGSGLSATVFGNSSSRVRIQTMKKKLLVKMKSGGSWDFVRFIVVVVIISVFIFLFLTRQEVSTKIIGLLTSLSVVLPLIFKLGSSTGPAGADKK